MKMCVILTLPENGNHERQDEMNRKIFQKLFHLVGDTVGLAAIFGSLYVALVAGHGMGF